MHAVFFIETIMDHIASFLGNKGLEEVQEINICKDNQVRAPILL